MKIYCTLTNSTEYNQFCNLVNGVYALKISRNFKWWYYNLCDLIDFYSGSDVELDLDIEKPEIALARELYGEHKFNEKILREYETKVLVHSTPHENVDSILNDNALKSWNICKAKKPDWEQEPIGILLGDIADFSNYVMLSTFFQNSEVITASKQKHEINVDPEQKYQPGARFYLDGEKLAADGLLLRDGEHIKVKDRIPFDKYLIWYLTAERLGIDKTSTPKEFYELSNNRFFELYPEYKIKQV